MTISERYFDKYLNIRKIKFEIEKGNTVHPDRILHFPNNNVVCEIKQLEKSYKNPHEHFHVGSADPYTYLRKAIRRKIRQGKEAKLTKTPYVIVLYDYSSDQIMINEVIEAAMYGNLAFVFDISNKGRNIGKFFSDNGILRHARSYKELGEAFNKRVSAIAVLDIINPTQINFDKAYEKATTGVDIKDIKKLIKIMIKVEKKLIKEGKYNSKLRVQRLRVFHNFYADNPLDFNIFNGEFDKQYFIDASTGESKTYAE